MNMEEAMKVTKGQTDAAVFLVDYIRYCHLIDDVIDKDKLVDDERLVKSSLAILGNFAYNPWVMQNMPRIFPLMVSGFNAWLDANKMEWSQDERVRLSADTVKGIYHEMVYAVAFLIGGYDHMRLVSRNREYDYDQQKENV